MCAADEVALVDTMDGADLGTLATACALRIIDRGEVVDNVDCIVGAVLFALAAGDTAVCARSYKVHKGKRDQSRSLLQVPPRLHRQAEVC